MVMVTDGESALRGETTLRLLEDVVRDYRANGRDLDALRSMEHALQLRAQLIPYQQCSMQHNWQADLFRLCRQFVMVCNSLAMRALRDDAFHLAFELLKKAEGICREEEFPIPQLLCARLLATTHNNIGCFYRRRGKLHAALQYASSALNCEVELEMASKSSSEVVYHEEDGIGTEIGSTEKMQTKHQQHGLPAVHLNLCAILSQLGRHGAALQHARSALAILTSQRRNSSPTGVHAPLAEEGSKGTTGSASIANNASSSLVCVALHNIAVEWEFLHKLEKACEAYDEALLVAEESLGPSHGTTLAIAQSFKQCREALERKTGVAFENRARELLRSRAAAAGNGTMGSPSRGQRDVREVGDADALTTKSGVQQQKKKSKRRRSRKSSHRNFVSQMQGENAGKMDAPPRRTGAGLRSRRFRLAENVGGVLGGDGVGQASALKEEEGPHPPVATSKHPASAEYPPHGSPGRGPRAWKSSNSRNSGSTADSYRGADSRGTVFATPAEHMGSPEYGPSFSGYGNLPPLHLSELDDLLSSSNMGTPIEHQRDRSKGSVGEGEDEAEKQESPFGEAEEEPQPSTHRRHLSRSGVPPLEKSNSVPYRRPRAAAAPSSVYSDVLEDSPPHSVRGQHPLPGSSSAGPRAQTARHGTRPNRVQVENVESKSEMLAQAGNLPASTARDEGKAGPQRSVVPQSERKASRSPRAGSPGRLAAGKDPVKFEEDRDRLYSLMLSIGNTIGALEEFTRTAATEVEEEGDDKKEEGHEAGSRKPSTLTEDDLLRICETFGLCDDEKEVEAAS